MSDGLGGVNRGDFVILSGEYCGAEIVAEFGRLPPAFLPVSNCRLYELQLVLAKGVCDQVTISLPEDYDLTDIDERVLTASGIRIVRVPGGLTLAESLRFVLDMIGAAGELFLLHGDTLVQSSELGELDVVGTTVAEGFYNWADVEEHPGREIRLRTGYGDGFTSRRVACGYFTFSTAQVLREALGASEGFIDAINRYSTQVTLRGKEVDKWYDFGHLSLYYRSKRDLLVSRCFNQVQADGVRLLKTSSERAQIEAEINWYKNVPVELLGHTPQFLGEYRPDSCGPTTPIGYSLEYLYLPTLSELSVFGKLPHYVWKNIIKECLRFLELCAQFRPQEPHPAAKPEFAVEFYQHVVVQKCWTRLAKFSEQRRFDLSRPVVLNGASLPCVGRVAQELIDMVRPTDDADIRLWHGDFFFGNILFDFRANRIKVVDPRGMLNDGALTVFGDWRYDQAKLAHSVYGRYDHILAGHAWFRTAGAYEFELRLPEAPEIDSLQHDLASLSVEGHPLLSSEVKALAALLFLSMLPLHSEAPQRQLVFLANGLRIYSDLIGDPA